MPTEPPQDIVEEARAKLAKPNYGMGKRNRELMTKLCDEVERLRLKVEVLTGAHIRDALKSEDGDYESN